MPRLIPNKLAGVIAVSLIVLGIAIGLLNIHRFAPIPKQPSVNHIQTSAVRPVKRDIDTYRVSPDVPKYLSIQSLRIKNARVVSLGLSADNKITVPSNIYDAGWFNQSKKPGQDGAAFVYGHVSNWQANGIFYDLKDLRVDDLIVVTRGDDVTYTYKVVAKKTYDYKYVDMAAVLAPAAGVVSGLNLMTCGGYVIEGTSEFSERLVIFTSLVDTTK